ncbi:MAG TPA: VCBS repeat-containing protein [Planctomycetota bacterium]
MITIALTLALQEHTIITWKKHVLSEVFTCEGAAAGDFNKDGVMDVAAGPWWYEGPDYTKKHEFYPVKVWKTDNEYSNNFFAFTDDFNKDGWTDIFVYGFPGADVSWFENPQGKDGHWKKNVVHKAVDNESPQYEDVDGDGVRDVVASVGGHLGYVTVADGKFHPISPKGGWQRFTHGLGLGDINGDGKKDFIESGGWWEQPKSLAGDPEWVKHPTNFGGGAQYYAYDVDGDGDNDVVGSLRAHGYGLAWWEHTKENGEIKLVQRIIMNKTPEENKYGLKFSQLHAVDLVDVDGDGLKDIVTGKRHFAHGSKGDDEPLAAPVLYWFKLARNSDGIDWIPYQIDDNSGVGTQVTAVDMNGDKRPDIVVGCKKGAFVHIQTAQKVSKDEWEKAQPKVAAK